MTAFSAKNLIDLHREDTRLAAGDLYSVPEMGHALERDRLFDLMDQDPGACIFFVTGQAAQGKSTLVASYLNGRAHEPRKRLWLSMASADFESGLESLEDQFTHAADCGLDIVLDDLCDPDNREDLDNTDDPGQASSAFGLINRLIARAAGQTRAHIRLFLISRTWCPSLDLKPLKAEQRIRVIDNKDLRFNREETERFFFRIFAGAGTDPVISSDDMDMVQDMTDGWAGGLVLAADALRRYKDFKTIPGQVCARAFAYFSDEIYGKLSRRVHRFLMETALFDSLEPDILGQFYESDDSEPSANTDPVNDDPLARLKTLESNNLFIHKTDSDPQNPVFRYHCLFRQFLQSELNRNLTREKITELEKRAGRIFWEQMRHEQAADHFARAGAFDELSRLIRIKGADYLLKGEVPGLEMCLDKMPGDVVKNDPWLLFFHCMIRRIRQGRSNFENLIRAHNLFKALDDHRGLLLTTAYIIEAAVFIRQPSCVINDWIKTGQGLLRQRKGSRKYTWARAVLWQYTGLGHIEGTGNFAMGISACQNARLLFKGIDNRELILDAAIVQAFGLVQAGYLQQADQVFSWIAQQNTQGCHPEYQALKRLALLNYALKMGQFSQAEHRLEQASQDMENYGLIFLYPGFIEARALVFAGMANFSRAFQAADHLADFSVMEGSDFYQGIALRLKSMISLLAGNHADSLVQAQSAVKALEGKDPDIHYVIARKHLGFALYFNDDFKQAAVEFEQALCFFKEISSSLDFCETAFMAGLTAWRLGQASHGTDLETIGQLLGQGLEKVLENQYGCFPLMNKSLLARVLVLHALTGSMEPVKSAFKLWQKTIDGTDIRKETVNILDSLPVSASQYNTEGLRELYRLSLPKLEIRTLGEFSVTIAGRRLSGTDFSGEKPRHLLKTIIINRLNEIPREILIDRLWPDASARVGEKNLKVNLHRLRKALEPEFDKRLGYFYVIQKSGHVTLDPDLVALDTDQFTRLMARADKLESQKEYQAAVDTWQKALDLYQEDYFSADPYLEEIVVTRVTLKGALIKGLEKKARLHQDLEQWHKAVDTWQALLKYDSCSERAYGRLMQLYADKGFKNRALELYEQCCQRLSRQLDVEPGDELVIIYQKIRG